MQALKLKVIFFIAISALIQSVDAKPVVLASIKPLSLIAREIVGEYADVETLIPSTASHHDYPLKMSDYSRLQAADLVVWVGPELESFLQKPLKNIQPSRVITTSVLTGMQWPKTTYQIGEQDAHHYDHDPHLWLDPRNAAVVAQSIALKMKQIDPAHSLQYEANLRVFWEKLTQLDTKLLLLLSPVKGVGFAVYHEGFAHFVGRYGLHQLDYVMFTPEQKSGAKHLNQLRMALAKEGVCLFLEPYNDLDAMHNLAQELHLQMGTLDAMGGQGTDSYVQLMEQMGAAFSACLTNGRIK